MSEGKTAGAEAVASSEGAFVAGGGAVAERVAASQACCEKSDKNRYGADQSDRQGSRRLADEILATRGQ